MGTIHRPSTILNDPNVREYAALLEIARRQVASGPAVADPERTARAMVESYYRGRFDRERIDRIRMAVPA